LKSRDIYQFGMFSEVLTEIVVKDRFGLVKGRAPSGLWELMLVIPWLSQVVEFFRRRFSNLGALASWFLAQVQTVGGLRIPSPGIFIGVGPQLF